MEIQVKLDVCVCVWVKSWPEEDIASAITLRSLSPKCYKYLKDIKGFPLPCVSSLNNRLKELNCEPGLLSDVLSLMNSQSNTLETIEKLAVKSFDEMSIDSHWSYDKGTDTLYKPHQSVQVMLRGFASRWRQPIFYDFDMAKRAAHLARTNRKN